MRLKDNDPVEHPDHYQLPSGIEVKQITMHLNFCLGNVIKYVLRCDKKDNPIEDLRKAREYIDMEIGRRLGEQAKADGYVYTPTATGRVRRAENLMNGPTQEMYYGWDFKVFDEEEPDLKDMGS